MRDTVVHVVAGVLRDREGRILLTQRPAGKHLAGLWEFPGGKCEPGEAAPAALRRELREELGIETGAAQKLIALPWRYVEKSILLDVYNVLDFSGTPHGHEGQQLRWVASRELRDIAMPPADRPVISALQLPRHYAITPEPAEDADFLPKLQRMLECGAKLVQLRSKTLTRAALPPLLAQARRLATAVGARLLLNGHADLVAELGLDGVHLPAGELMRCRERPLAADRWVGASCHDGRELAHAAAIGVDFAVLGPVKHTSTHPSQTPLGWPRFAQLCTAAPFPVYALGGLHHEDLSAAIDAGAQGIAGISAFWPTTADAP